MSTIDCFWHGPETERPDDYGSCLECAHIWRTRRDWEADCETLARELGVPVVYELTACPLCAHDLLRLPWDWRGEPIISASHRTAEGARLLPGSSGTVSGRPRTPEEG